MNLTKGQGKRRGKQQKERLTEDKLIQEKGKIG